MTKRHYFQSLIIFLASVYFLKTVLEIEWVEAILLILLAIICVVHTIDLMIDWDRRKIARERKNKELPE